MIKAKRQITPEEARERMAALCARSEQAPSEILLKLSRLHISWNEAQEIVEWLTHHQFLDPLRFARAFANDKVRLSLWGRNKIRLALRAKGIDDAIIKIAISEIDLQEYKKAFLRALKNTLKSCNPSLAEERMKIARRLAARGYESALIFKALDKISERNK